MSYDLETDNIIKAIKSGKCKKVMLQLPDGLKPKANEIADSIKKSTKADVFIWLGTNYGSCDIPDVNKLGIDLLVTYGHSPFKRTEGWK
jgi:2-(3-amino-3-carboxypropyl)histidine synthase